MSTPLLIGIICGGVLIAIIIAIIFIRRANKKRFKKLQENLQKYKTEKENLEHDNKITLSKDQENTEPIKAAEEKPAENRIESSEKKVETEKQGPIIEDYVPPESTFSQPRRMQPERTTRTRQPRNLENREILDLLNSERSKMNASPQRREQKDDFEAFLDEHAYSRRILNKDILSKIKDLPPEIKAVILSNVFNKYDD